MSWSTDQQPVYPTAAVAPRRTGLLAALAALCVVLALVAMTAVFVTLRARSDLDATKANLERTRAALAVVQTQAKADADALAKTEKDLQAMTARLTQATTQVQDLKGSQGTQSQQITDLTACLDGYDTIEQLIGEGDSAGARRAALAASKPCDAVGRSPSGR